MPNQRFLTIYSGILTFVFAVTVLSGFAGRTKKVSFDEINVRRINIIEPDGTLRMILSNKTDAPGMFIRGKEYPHPDRKSAGVIFVDDEGTENGGLIFGGFKNKEGKVESWGHLSFDQYQQDQVFSIDAGEEEGHRRSGIGISDRGDYPILEAVEATTRIGALPGDQQEAEYKKFVATHGGDAQRAYFGRVGDGSVVLRLKDKQGRDRIVLQVNADGTPVLQLLDANGKMTAQLPPQDHR